MPDPGWPLLELVAESVEKQKEQCRDIYLREYVQSTIRDWQGRRIKFHAHSFDHAFSQSGNYRLSAGVHEVDFSKVRAQRIRWINLALTSNEVNIEVVTQTRTDSRGRPRKRRTVIVLDNRYVVVLEPIIDQEYAFEFVTAFHAEQSYLDKIRRGAQVVERRKADIKKPQSYGD